MAIRYKNIRPQESVLTKHYSTLFLGDRTATTSPIVFTAPFNCVLESASFYSGQRVSAASASAQITFQLLWATNTNNALGAIASTSATAGNQIISQVLFALNVTANNSLTVGQPIVLNISVGGSGVTSETFLHMTYYYKQDKGPPGV